MRHEGPIEQDRIRALLQARPPSPAPRNQRQWLDYIRSLQEAARHAIPELKAACEAAEAAMWAATREASHRAWEKDRAHVDADWQAALSCEMRAPNVRGLTARQCGERRVCFLCGKWPIPPRRQHWCSDACVVRWTQNHEWSAARGARVRADANRCTRCGREGGTVLIDVCGDCGKAWEEGDSGRECPYNARPRLFDAGYGRNHVRHQRRLELQVNHIDPREGRGYHKGCHNHQDRLESLCQPDHAMVTTEQGRARRAREAAARSGTVGAAQGGAAVSSLGS